MIFRKITVNAITNIGALSARRTELFKDFLAKDFPIFQVPAPGMAAICHNGMGKAVVLTPNQVSLSLNKVSEDRDIEFNPDEIMELFTKVFEAPFLSLDPMCKINIQLEAVEEMGYDVGAQSIKSNNMGSFSGIRGVGIRVMIDDEKFQGDYRVEPLVTHMTYAFYELLVETKLEVSIDKLKEIFVEMINRFNSTYKDSTRWYFTQ